MEVGAATSEVGANTIAGVMPRKEVGAKSTLFDEKSARGESVSKFRATDAASSEVRRPDGAAKGKISTSNVADGEGGAMWIAD